MTSVTFCNSICEFPSGKLSQLRDANDLLGDSSALGQRMNNDGYWWFKGFFDRDAVIQARRAILEFMDERGGIKPNTDLMDGIYTKDAADVALMGNQDITHHKDVRRILEAPELYSFFGEFFAEEAASFAYKWLRATIPGAFTGVHMDHVYMGMGSQDLHTAWIPFGDITPTEGSLTLAPGSHKAESFRSLRDTYGKIDVDRDQIPGWYSTSPDELTAQFDARWQTACFEMGDVVIFGLHTFHCSTTNSSDHLRLSADVRFQPASQPMDERWSGENPKGHGHVPSNAGKPLRKEDLDAQLAASLKDQQ